MLLCCCAAEPDLRATVIAHATGDEEAHTFQPVVSARVTSWQMQPESAASAKKEAPPPAPLSAAALVRGGEAPECFIVDMEKQTVDEPLGLHLDLSDGTFLQVCGLRTTAASPVQLYNDRVPGDKKLRAGDYIKAVNDIAGSSIAMADAMKASARLRLLVQRPRLFTCRVEKKGEPMGLDLNYSEKGTSLVVVRVGEGAVQRTLPGLIHPGDRIMSINGIRGEPMTLLRAVQDCLVAEMEVSRPS